ncbi:hypothetical protein CJ030_MR5G021887 [Morella rubra]|uniref:Uncharacterized protein n=1 Tax=Morella rubra TaxID=262757 RepID=A0A6A1VP77_9ROSI|nr:hypothetical protein CJ030_MR5G021878 [Morella rubra]KAB1213755.1 hypothetical protein CJ030_MR5G021887 [Morella rubra]
MVLSFKLMNNITLKDLGTALISFECCKELFEKSEEVTPCKQGYLFLQEGMKLALSTPGEFSAHQTGNGILCNGLKQVDACENDLVDYRDGSADGRKGSVELVTLADVQSLDSNPANAGVATDDDADINFFDDDLSD